jgi:hypothetical protein
MGRTWVSKFSGPLPGCADNPDADHSKQATAPAGNRSCFIMESVRPEEGMPTGMLAKCTHTGQDSDPGIEEKPAMGNST